MRSSSLARKAVSSSNSLRFFSAVRAEVPKKFHDFVIDRAQSLPGYKDASTKKAPDAKDSFILAKESVEMLKDATLEGCQDSVNLLGSLRMYKFDNNCGSLFLRGMPIEKIPAIYFSSVMAGIAGYGLCSNPAVRSLTDDVTYIEGTEELMLHTDIPIGKFAPDMISLMCRRSDGSIGTAHGNPEMIFRSLSESSRKILSQPIFNYNLDPMEVDSENFGIFYIDQMGKLRMALDFEMRPWLTYPKDENLKDIEYAVEEVHQVSQEKYDQGKFESYNLMTGDGALQKNFLHTRFGLSNKRRKLTSILYSYDDSLSSLLPFEESDIPSANLEEGEVGVFERLENSSKVLTP